MSEDTERIKKKNLLLSYYNQNNSLGAGDSIQNGSTMSNYNSEVQIHLKDPFDINSTSFEPDLFLKKLIKVFYKIKVCIAFHSKLY